MNVLRRNLLKFSLLSLGGVFLFPLYKTLLTSAVFAYAVHPSKKFFRRIVKNNALASIICLLFWMFVVLGIIVLLVSMAVFAVQEAQTIILSSEFNEVMQGLRTVFESNPFGKILIDNLNLQSIVSFSASIISRLLVFAPTLLLQVSMILLFSYYFLKDGDKILRFLTDQFSGDTRGRIELVLKQLNKVFFMIIYGYIATAIIIGALVFTCLTILEVPYSFLLGFLATIFSIIPLAGALIPSAIAFVYLFTQGSFLKLGVLIIFNVILSFVDNVVRAFISDKGAKEYKVHPLLFICGIISGSVFFGPIGLIVGPMVFAALTVILRFLN